MSRTSRWKLPVTGLCLLGSILVAEGLLRLGSGGYASAAARSEVEQLVQHVAGGDLGEQAQRAPRGDRQLRSLHPFFGYDTAKGDALFERYVGQHLEEGRAERFTVAICGGSVAETFIGMRRGAADVLAERLAADPRIAGRKVQILRFARAGYKQPQQLGKLTYFLSRGSVPDVVINIDGLNEMRAGVRNLNFGVPTSFPPASHWLHLAGPGGGSAEARELEDQRDAFLAHAERSLEGGWFRSAIAGRWTQRKLKARFAQWSESHDRYEAELARAVKLSSPSDSERCAAAQDCCRNWVECSKLMNDLCAARGISYLHLLQPTLHDVGSKPITSREQELGVGEAGLDPDIPGWYVALRAGGQELVDAGIPFVDTSGMFADVEETLYFDKAHFGREGNVLLAERIALELLTRL